MASVQQLKTQIENVNALGRTNLSEKGVELPETATTYEIMRGIGNISSGGASLNIAYGETPPEDTSKLWIKANEPNNIKIGSDIFDEKTIENIGTTLPNANHAMACARVGNKIYLLGGYSTPKAINVFDIKTKTIQTLSVILNNDFAGVSGWASVGTKIYLFGCYNFTYGKNIQVFDTETETITTLDTQIPEALCAMACARVGNKIYLLGGNNQTSATKTIYKFDTETETFTRLTSQLSYAVDQVNCASVGTKIYLFGGYDGYSPQNYIQIFDTKTETVTTGQLPTAIYAMACAAVGKKIYLFGGYNNGNKNAIYEFDTETNLTNTLDVTLPTVSRETSGATNGNAIYLFGGAGAAALNTINCFTVTHELAQGNIELQSGLLKNEFNLINTENAQVQVGVENVYIGNANNEAELCEAYLHNGTEWQQI